MDLTEALPGTETSPEAALRSRTHSRIAKRRANRARQRTLVLKLLIVGCYGLLSISLSGPKESTKRSEQSTGAAVSKSTTRSGPQGNSYSSDVGRFVPPPSAYMPDGTLKAAWR